MDKQRVFEMCVSVNKDKKWGMKFYVDVTQCMISLL